MIGTTGISGDRPPMGPVTKRMIIALFAVSLIGSMTQRSVGFGVQDLMFSVDKIFSLELWRILTYPFVESRPWDLIISALLLYLFGQHFEQRWGSRDYGRFVAFSCVGAALFAIPLHIIFNILLPFRDVGFAAGPNPAIDAMLIAFALTAPRSNMMLGFVLPVRMDQAVYILLGIQLIFGVMTGSAQLSTTLGGMLMGYLLVTGKWRRSGIKGVTESLKKDVKQRLRRAKNPHHLHIVKPESDNSDDKSNKNTGSSWGSGSGPTLH